MNSDRSGSESFSLKKKNFTDSENNYSNNISDIIDNEEDFSEFLDDVEVNTEKYEFKVKETYYNILNINLEKENFGKKIKKNLIKII